MRVGHFLLLWACYLSVPLLSCDHQLEPAPDIAPESAQGDLPADAGIPDLLPADETVDETDVRFSVDDDAPVNLDLPAEDGPGQSDVALDDGPPVVKTCAPFQWETDTFVAKCLEGDHLADACLLWTREADGGRAEMAVSDDDRIYSLTSSGTLSALCADGQLLWSQAVGTSANGPPVILDDGTIVASVRQDGCASSVDPSFRQRYGTTVAFNPDGTILWQRDSDYWATGVAGIRTDGTILAAFGMNPSYRCGGCCAGWCWDDWECMQEPNPHPFGRIATYSEAGTPGWQTAFDSWVGGAAAVRPDGSSVFGTGSYYFGPNPLVAISATGQVEWASDPIHVQLPGPVAMDASGRSFVGDDAGVVRAILQDGSTDWTFQARAQVYSPVLVGPAHRLYFGDNAGYLYVLEPSGELAWELALGSRTTAGAIGADGVVYVSTLFGNIIAVQDEGPQGRLIWRRSWDLGEYTFASVNALTNNGILLVSVSGIDRAITAAIGTSSKGLAMADWPKSRHDNRNTGRAPSLDREGRPTNGLNGQSPADTVPAPAPPRWPQ